MWNKLVTIAALIAAGYAAFAEMSIEEQKRWEAVKARPCIISREKKLVGNDWLIIEHWKNPQDGREWRTNKVFKVTGKKQDTTWRKQMDDKQAELDAEKVEADKARKVEKNAAKAKQKDQKNFDKWISDTKKAKSKSSEDMAEFYDAILELAEQEGN